MSKEKTSHIERDTESLTTKHSNRFLSSRKLEIASRLLYTIAGASWIVLSGLSFAHGNIPLGAVSLTGGLLFLSLAGMSWGKWKK